MVGKTKGKLKTDWKKEVARDILALGSIPFYFIVVIRAIIGKYLPFVYELVIAFTLLFILSRFIKFDQYLSRGLVLVVFTSLFYKEYLFTTFAFVLWFLIIYSSRCLNKETKEIIRGIVLGVIVSAVSYYLVLLL
jgi:hypothetical protein